MTLDVGNRVKVFWPKDKKYYEGTATCINTQIGTHRSHKMMVIKKFSRRKMNNTFVLSKIILAMNQSSKTMILKIELRLIMLRVPLHVVFQVKIISLLRITLIFSDSKSSSSQKHKDFQVMSSKMHMKTKKRLF